MLVKFGNFFYENINYRYYCKFIEMYIILCLFKKKLPIFDALNLLQYNW